MNTSLMTVETLARAWFLWMASMGWQVALVGGLVWLATSISRKRSAALRYALWLLVFVKLVLPPTLSAPWSAGTIAAHLASVSGTSVQTNAAVEAKDALESGAARDTVEKAPGRDSAAANPLSLGFYPARLLLGVWAAGALVLLTMLLF
jgi:beta-lactamase regulating signal transducer with metallopeptidase domain